ISRGRLFSCLGHPGRNARHDLPLSTRRWSDGWSLARTRYSSSYKHISAYEYKCLLDFLSTRLVEAMDKLAAELNRIRKPAQSIQRQVSKGGHSRAVGMGWGLVLL